MRYAVFSVKNAGNEKLLTYEVKKALLKNKRGDLWEK